MSATAFLQLSDDIFIEILGILPALDIIQCRRVCRRLHSTSKSRSLWINVLRRSVCLLPSIDMDSTTTPELEKILGRAEILEKIWTGNRQVVPEIRFVKPPNRRSGCIGTLGPYIICTTRGFPNHPEYSWYQLEPSGDLSLRFEFQLPFRQEEPWQRIWDGHYLETGTNTLHLALITAGGPAGPILDIFHVTAKPGGVGLYVVVKPPICLDHHLVDMRGSRTIRMLDSGFLHMRYMNSDGTVGKVILVQMETGKMIMSPSHRTYPPSSSDIQFVTGQLDIFVTDLYLIQVVRGTEFEFFKLPPHWVESSEVSPIIAERTTIAGSFPCILQSIWHIYPSSPELYTVLGLSNATGVQITLLTIDIDRQSVSRNPTVHKQLPDEGIIYISPKPYPPLPSVVGFVTNHNPPTGWSRHLAFRVALTAPDSTEPLISTVGLDVPTDTGLGLAGYYLHYAMLDPFSGRGVLATSAAVSSVGWFFFNILPGTI